MKDGYITNHYGNPSVLHPPAENKMMAASIGTINISIPSPTEQIDFQLIYFTSYCKVYKTEMQHLPKKEVIAPLT